jgi:lysophospholipase L1-like esterase
LAPFPVIRRGFGGSQIDDSLRYVERIVIPYAPKMVVIYAGDNDLANGRTQGEIFDDYKSLVAKIHAALPQCKIAYLSIKPSIARWHLINEIRATNALIEAFAARDERLDFIDTFGISLGDDGRPLPDIFVEDDLHLNRKGYDLWTVVIKAYLEREFAL